MHSATLHSRSVLGSRNQLLELLLQRVRPEWWRAELSLREIRPVLVLIQWIEDALCCVLGRHDIVDFLEKGIRWRLCPMLVKAPGVGEERWRTRQLAGHHELAPSKSHIGLESGQKLMRAV